ncbi:pilus assembly protein, partial [Francisella tularensis subsp. holarctica]|nr:pilus assembly protein [Francisella tularensis subsp. holarctica]
QNEAKPEENLETVNRFKPLSVADIRKMAEKADKKNQKAAANDVDIIYKVVNIAAIDNQLGVADCVKIIEQEVKQDDNQAQ